jgi:hypothetical protein
MTDDCQAEVQAVRVTGSRVTGCPNLYQEMALAIERESRSMSPVGNGGIVLAFRRRRGA